MKRLLMTGAILVAAGCSSGQPQHTSSQAGSPGQQQASYMGPSGPAGPAGVQGERGATGRTGEPALAAAGPRGQAGPGGFIGERGPAGARGPAGGLDVGPEGTIGPAGAAGPEGARGARGVRGPSSEGHAGEAGPAGQRGTAGVAGPTGERGPALTGPAGPEGRPGEAGPRGEVGQTGTRGRTTAGVAGEAGAAGPTGPQGSMGPAGPLGPVGVIEHWTMYREFWFDDNEVAIHDADWNKAKQIAAYLKQNPSLHVGIDSATNRQGSSDGRNELAARRGNAVRDVLRAAGIPAAQITQGEFGNVNDRRTNRVGLLIKTDPNHLARQDRQAEGDAADLDTAGGWQSHSEFSFDENVTTIHAAQTRKVAQIATYMTQNPSVQLGLDGSPNSQATDRAIMDRCDERVNAIRDALVAAGVPTERISLGQFGQEENRRDNHVQVFTRSGQIVRE